MKLSLDKVLEKCPRKLLKLIPQIMERIAMRQDAPEYLKGEIEPLIILVPGSRGCLDGDSLLETAKGLVKIKDFRGGLIKSWDGQKLIWAYAGPSVEYQPKELYEVRLENGDCFVATANHYALARDGFVPIANAMGKELATVSSLPHSTVGTSLSEWRPDVRHLTGIILNCLYGYWLDCHHGGEPLQLGVDTYLGIVPSLSDAQISNDDAWSRMDGLLVLLRKYARAYHGAGLLSIGTVRCPSAGQDSEGEDIYIYARFFEWLNEFYLTYHQFPASCIPVDIKRQLLTQLEKFLNEISQDENLLSSCGLSSLAFDDNSYSDTFSIQTDNIPVSRVKSIKRVGEKKYYDIFVPYFHTYIANGVLHHNSGKSEWAQRMTGSGMHDGYIKTAKYATMTENGLNGSKDAFERIFPECVGTGGNVSKREPMHRYIYDSRIDFDFFGKQDIKNEQKKYDVLICEEVEKWDKVQGVAALETEIRHCSVIILISNNPPQSVVDFCKAHNALIIRIDWWENTALPPHIRAAYERAKVESPVYYSRFIMCQNDTDSAPWFDNTGIENFFSRKYEELGEKERASKHIVLGIDVGGGYGDESVIAKISRNEYGAVLVEVFGKYQLESPALVVKAAQARAATHAIEEVWDASGIGLTTLQQRAPDPMSRRALGVVSFIGNGKPSDETIFNTRTEAYHLWQKLINGNQCWYVGNPTYIDQIKREMYAQVYATSEQSKGTLRLADKKEVKKNLNGESPNIADAIAMGIWRVMTHTPKPTDPRNDLIGGVRRPMQNKRWF